MLGRIRELIRRWRYLGYDKETVQRYRAETDRANLHTLRRMCLLSMALEILMAVYFGAFMRQQQRLEMVLVFAVLLLITYFYVSYLLRRFSTGPIHGTKPLVFLISTIMYLFGMISGTWLSGGELGVLSVWMFLLVQISFDIPPLQNALTVIPFAALYLFLDKLFKTPDRWHMDIAYTFLSVSVGLFISHHQTKLALDNTIAQSNLVRANFALYHTATTDELTGLMNRRMLFDRYDAILSECEETHRSVACVVLDIDDYKQYNDKYGHPAGDDLLRRIGGTLKEYGKRNDIEIGRIGGEEFLAVWPEEDAKRCEEVAEELRRAIEQMAIAHAGALEHDKVTMSVGLCLLPSEMAQGAYLYADKALYRAKDAGKNCSCRYEPVSSNYRMVCGRH